MHACKVIIKKLEKKTNGCSIFCFLKVYMTKMPKVEEILVYGFISLQN